MKLDWKRRIAGRISITFLALVLGLPAVVHADWHLVWSDEFNGTNVNTGTWAFETGNGSGGWGNNEREYYTGRTNNAYVGGGSLHITARQESMGGFPYTSARMKTQGLYSKKYGWIEFRAKLPQGVGCWPALWMMGNNFNPVGWPACGEIDIKENKGSSSNVIGAALHYSDANNNHLQQVRSYTLPTPGDSVTLFHTYAIEWSTNSLRWLVDSNTIQTWTNWSSSTGPYPAPYDQPFYILMNLAIGGNYLANPTDTQINAGTAFPVEMEVDYVRVYDFIAVPAPPNAPPGLTASPGNAKVFLSWDDSTSGATAYLVKRATNSGGPYAIIAAPSVNTYTDSTVGNCGNYYYVVSATNSFGASTNSSEQTAVLGAFATAVSSGGGAAGQFGADANFSGGTQAAPATSEIDTTGVTAPAPQAVYQTERYGNFTYTFTGLTAGLTYKVRLHFAETYWSAVGARRFNVAINGAQVLSNFDIIATAGAANKAVIQEFNAVPSGGQIVIQYTTVTDNAKASGIEILLPRPAAPVAGNNGPIWTGMNLNLTALTVPGAVYSWTGPNGFVSSSQNPSILNAPTNASGVYRVTAAIGGCASLPATTAVTVNPPPLVSLQSLGTDVVLSWPAGTLQSATNITGPWIDVSGAISPRTNPAAMAQEFYRVSVP